MAKQILVVLSGIILLMLGAVSGLVYQIKKDAPLVKSQQIQQSQKTGQASDSFSKVITTLTAYGKVTNIQGNVITLASGNDTMQLHTSSITKIYIIKDSSKPLQLPGSMQDIKVGERLSATLVPSSSDQFQISIIFLQPDIK